MDLQEGRIAPPFVLAGYRITGRLFVGSQKIDPFSYVARGFGGPLGLPLSWAAQFAGQTPGHIRRSTPPGCRRRPLIANKRGREFTFLG